MHLVVLHSEASLSTLALQCQGPQITHMVVLHDGALSLHGLLVCMAMRDLQCTPHTVTVVVQQNLWTSSDMVWSGRGNHNRAPERASVQAANHASSTPQVQLGKHLH